MAGPYSTGLRSRVLAVMDAGESPAAAKRFAVARPAAYGWGQTARRMRRRHCQGVRAV
jgi:hypothetical protein